MSTLAPVGPDPRAPSPATEAADGPSGARRLAAAAALVGVVAAHVALVLRTAPVATPFEDEGLYLYVGHRMLDHLLHRSVVVEDPGAYLSGAPALYPVLGALADSAGGLEGARLLSTVFSAVTVVAVFGLGRSLHGPTVGLLGAAAFGVQGSVLFIAGLATFDAMMLMMVVLAAWAAVASARRDGLQWAPMIGVLLALAVLVKYGGVAYVPVVAALAWTVGRPLHGRSVTRATVVMLVCTAVALVFLFAVWGRSLLPGVGLTTVSRTVLVPESAAGVARRTAELAGPWLLASAVGAVAVARRRDRWAGATAGVLVLASVLAPLQQARIGEAASLERHVAFGIAFAAPLVGVAALAALRLAARAGRPAVAAAATALVLGLAALAAGGLRDAHDHLTTWADDTRLAAVLRAQRAPVPQRPILGEQPAPERWALRGTVVPEAWRETYAFGHKGRTGLAAMEAAVDDHTLGIVYLSGATEDGRALRAHLAERTDLYRRVASVPRVMRGRQVGTWDVFVADDVLARGPSTAESNWGKTQRS